MGRAGMRPPERAPERSGADEGEDAELANAEVATQTSGRANPALGTRRPSRRRVADREPRPEPRPEPLSEHGGTPTTARPVPTGALPPGGSAPTTSTVATSPPSAAAPGDLASLAARPSSGRAGDEWAKVLHRIRANLEERLPAGPGRERLGIQDIARAADLTVQQVRLMERQGLVRPAFEVSGRKRNRRYTRDEALLILAAAQLMHRHGIRPAQAATFVLARGLDSAGASTTRPDAVEATNTRSIESAFETSIETSIERGRHAAWNAAITGRVPGHVRSDGVPPARDRAALDPTALAPALDLALDLGAEPATPASDAPGAGVLAAAAARLGEVIGARLVLIAVSALLGGRALPAQSILCVRRARGSRPAGDHEPAQTAPGHVAAVTAHPRPALPMRIVPAAPPHADPRLLDHAAPVYCAFVAAGGEVFHLPRTSTLLHQPRDWFALLPPVSGHPDPAAADRPPIEVLVGIPRGDGSPRGDKAAWPAGRLAPERYLLPAETADVSATLLWAVLLAIPDVIERALAQAKSGEVRVDRLAIEGGLIRVVLWLYAQVLARICPGIEQCDILAPHADPGGGAPVLYLAASSDPHEQGQTPRAIIHSGQLLSGFAFRFGQPAYVGDVNASHGILVSYRTLERARAAAAIPALFDRRPRACVYLFSRTGPVDFAPAVRRALEVAANEVAEVLRWKTLAIDLNHDGVLSVTRPYAPEHATALRSVIARWLRDIARASHSAGQMPALPAALASSALASSALAPTTGVGAGISGAHIPGALDDRCLVMVVVGAEPGIRFRGQGEILDWLDEAARTAAERLAQTLDEGAIDGARPLAGDDPLGKPFADADEEANEDAAPSAAARVFSWQAARRETEGSPVTAYVVLAGLNLPRPHVERLKELLRERGLSGGVDVRTEGGEPVGKLNAWVLHTKRSVAERMILARAASVAGTPDAPGVSGVSGVSGAARRVEQTLAEEITNCAHILPYIHEFHTEAFYRGNLERAIVILKRALPLAPDDMFVLRHLLDLYVRAGRLDEALALANTVSARDDSLPVKWHTTLARAYQIRGDFAAAIRALRRAMLADPANPLAYRLAGQTFLAAAGVYTARDHLAGGQPAKIQPADDHRATHALEWSARCLLRAIARDRARAASDAPRAEGLIVDTTLLLGDVLARQGRPDALLPLYEDLMAEFPHAAKDHVLFHDRLLAARRQRWHAHGRA